jgi:hypothetical protein
MTLQEPAFMLIQYIYALLTVTPCPIWFWYRWASALFLLGIFSWSIYNGAIYYIDIFGKRFQNELEQLKKDVAKWQSPSEGATSPLPDSEIGSGDGDKRDDSPIGQDGKASPVPIPPLDGQLFSSGVEKLPAAILLART